jgi:Histidinol dehydrogenase
MPARFLKSKQPPVLSSAQVDVGSIVSSVIDDVRANGDAAERKYSEKFDK